MYLQSAEQLEFTKKYLTEFEEKRFIRKSESPAGYLFLTVLKGDTLRGCVDYRELNNITIKNAYLLLLIAELQDRL